MDRSAACGKLPTADGLLSERRRYGSYTGDAANVPAREGRKTVKKAKAASNCNVPSLEASYEVAKLATDSA